MSCGVGKLKYRQGQVPLVQMARVDGQLFVGRIVALMNAADLGNKFQCTARWKRLTGVCPCASTGKAALANGGWRECGGRHSEAGVDDRSFSAVA